LAARPFGGSYHSFAELSYSLRLPICSSAPPLRFIQPSHPSFRRLTPRPRRPSSPPRETRACAIVILEPGPRRRQNFSQAGGGNRAESVQVALKSIRFNRSHCRRLVYLRDQSSANGGRSITDIGVADATACVKDCAAGD
jgi:hypothetical protein